LQSDCVIAVGSRTVDLNSAVFTALLPEKRIDIQAFWLKIDEQEFLGVNAREVLNTVTRQIPQKPKLATVVDKSHQDGQPSHSEDELLTQANFWPFVEKFLRPGDVLLAETGSSLGSLGAVRLPTNTVFIAQVIWGSIGYALPALLGTLLATPERRQILFIGDGSFQLTCQEVSTIISHDLKPIIFLINNKGYLIERTILGKTSPANDVADWHYSELPKVFAREAKTPPLCLLVKTIQELHKAIDQATNYKGLVFIEAELPKFDALEGLKKLGGALADAIYGVTGPQNTEGARLS